MFHGTPRHCAAECNSGPKQPRRRRLPSEEKYREAVSFTVVSRPFGRHKHPNHDRVAFFPHGPILGRLGVFKQLAHSNRPMTYGAAGRSVPLTVGTSIAWIAPRALCVTITDELKGKCSSSDRHLQYCRFRSP